MKTVFKYTALALASIFFMASCEKDEPKTSGCNCQKPGFIYNANNDSLAIANAFTPNNDGINDFLRVHRNFNFTVTNFNIRIFQNDNILVFESNNPADAWTGRNLENEELPEGSYSINVNFVADDATSVTNCHCVQLLRPTPSVGCVDTFNKGYVFPDQYSPATNRFSYPTAERACN